MATNIDTRTQRKAQPNPLVSFIQKNSQKVIRPAIAIAIFLAIWQLLCISPDANLPSPVQVFQDTWDPLIINPFFDNGGTDKGLGLQILASLGRVAIGFALATIVGIALGITIGGNEFMYDAVDPIFQVLRTIPPLAWLPISLAAFRDSQPSAIFVIFITAIWPIIINTTVGVQQIPQDYKNVARVLRLSKQKYFFKVLFPSAVPYIFTGLRIGIGLSWLAIVAAEMLVGGVGIGFFIWDAYNSSAISEIMLALVYVGIVGLFLDRMVEFIASKVVPEEKK
ncbi:MAG TPA: nitrate ABC transporter, permease protein [Cyanobacteria bacterium UBA11149]|nr:nitrate ABC transporter, permease protein [Cyanobacteria bacterium UBA11367]HBE59261.1 nitrate ABC transporter, permease protein [Cyanobacteria bacterium UBA11366]HBK64930.1 nitrate ABC transporter, permease protein [Cyanobacteria bacterium UBA11166]HBR74669.1 nitrate ABC transporter, permease protein [Cyanobacteria bacterium UBA11159]HBS71495.1 nitrate ABC transporter, permease protein [Cyanobacteria bacterium UBA11153]HBW89631.1 nitrate ABC transporter, permease protein [Cyanobacteria bac